MRDALLISPLGGVLSDAQGLQEAHLKDGDVVQLIEADLERRIASSGDPFAYIKSDGSVITWGGSGNGGDSSKVR